MEKDLQESLNKLDRRIYALILAVQEQKYAVISSRRSEDGFKKAIGTSISHISEMLIALTLAKLFLWN